MKPLNAFFSGAIMTASAVLGLFFLRFWKITRDRLFVYFSLAFFLMAIERWVLVLSPADGEFRPYVYLVRLVAFVVIAAAIIDKNRRPQKF